MNRTKVCVLLAVIFCAEFCTALPSDLFRIFDLKYEGNLQLYHAEDVNADGFKDILIMLKPLGSNDRPKLSLYLQQKDGFSGLASQTFEIDNTAILFDLGDVAGDLKKELVVLKNDGVYFYAFGINGFVLSPQKLFTVESAFMIPDREPVKWDLVSDVNGDGVEELLIAKLTRIDIYFRTQGGNWLINQLPITMESRAGGFYDPRFSVGNYAEVTYKTPFLATEDFDADGRKDLLAIYEDSLLVFCQEENGYFAQKCRQNVPLHFGEIWRGEKIQRTRIADKSERNYLMRIADLDHDGIVDAVSIRISTIESVVNPETEVRIFWGRRNANNSHSRVFFPEAPDHLIQPDGTQLVLDILDLNRDQRYDLIIPVIKIGIQNIIKILLSRSVEIRADIFLMTADGSYAKKPDTHVKMTVRFTYRGGATSPVYEVGDFDGDGFLDVLSSISEKTLAIFPGNEKNGIDDRIGPKFNVMLPQNGEMVRAMHLNSDNRCDVIITYNEDNALHKDLSKTLRILLAN
jgi:hypothetical protein